MPGIFQDSEADTRRASLRARVGENALICARRSPNPWGHAIRIRAVAKALCGSVSEGFGAFSMVASDDGLAVRVGAHYLVDMGMLGEQLHQRDMGIAVMTPSSLPGA